MKRFTVTLEDEGLYKTLESEAAKTGRGVDAIIKEALEDWLTESEMDEQETEEIDAARNEWEEQGGIEAREFFDILNEDAPRNL